MSTRDEPTDPALTAALTTRLHELAEASALPVPALVVDQPRKQERLPLLRKIDDEQTLVVPRSLLDASPPQQLWQLAGCLGRTLSPEPDRRRRLGGLLLAVLFGAYVVTLFAVRWQWQWITVLLLYPVGSWALRWERAAMDDAGRRVLTAAGHPPAEVARAAFGTEPDPPFVTRMLSTEPAPSRRIAAAEAAGGDFRSG